MFAHGFGCDQHMWRFITPAFESDYKIILFDYVGAGRSDKSALCKKITENHHVSIMISSGENEGTTIELFLPVDAGGVWV